MNYLLEFLGNKTILISIASWAVAQLIKILIDVIVNKRIDLGLIFATGGMPSSHSAFVASLATSLGLIYGFDSVYFSISFVLAIVVMYDAAGVRRAAGYQAATINKLIEILNVKIDEKLKELLGHTPVQVTAGAILGISIAIIANII